MVDVHRDPPDWLECVQEPDAAGSNQKTKEVEVEVEVESLAIAETPVKQEGAEMSAAMASDLPPLDVNGANSPRTRVGRGLESIGDVTAGTFQRITTAVGGVVKSPVVLMAKVGSLASPRAASLTSSPRTSLEERVFQLEIQMKSFEEKCNSRTVVTELNLSPRSHKEKPRIARSLLQEMETEGTLVKRVQMLEDRLNERMESIEKTLSSIQSQLALVDFSKPESVTCYEGQEILSGEPQYYDAEQQSDNLDALETLEPKSFEEIGAGAHFVPGEAIRASPTLEETPVKETSAAAPTTAEPVEPVQELGAGKSGDMSLRPQLASTSLEPKEALVKKPMEAAASTVKAVESVRDLDAVKSGDVSLEPQLVSTSVESKAAFVKQPMEAAAPSGEPAETVQELDAGKSGDVSEPQVASTSLKSKEAFVKQPMEAAAPSGERAGSVQGDDGGTLPASSDRQLTSTLEELHEAFVTEPSAAAASAKFLEIARADPAEKSRIVLASSEPQSASVPEEPQEAFAEEPSAAVLVANSEESAQEDGPYRTGIVIAAAELSSPRTFDSPQEDFVTESMVAAPSAESAEELATHEYSDMALASSEPQVASKFVEEPSAAASSAGLEEPAHEDAADKSGTMTAAVESPSASSFEEPQENFVKESLAAARSAEPAQELATQEDSDMALAASEPQVASKFVEEPSAAAPGANFEESAHEDAAEKSCPMIAAVESPSASSFEEPQEDFLKEPLAAARSAEPAQELATQEDGDMALASSEPQVASKFVEEPSAAAPSASFEESAHEDAAYKSDTMIAAAESSLASSFEVPQEDGVKESLADGASAKLLEPAQEDDSGSSAVGFASMEAQSASNLEEPQEALVKEPSGMSEEPAQEKSGTVLPAVESTLTSTLESQNGPQEEGNLASKEAEYKLAEDVKVPDEHNKSIEEAFPRSRSNLAPVGSDDLKLESLAAEDSDDRLESEQSGEEFFDAEQGSGNIEPWESVEQKSFVESGVGPDEPGEATGINAVAQKSFAPSPSAEPAQEPEQEPARELAQGPEKAEQDPAQEDPAGESGMAPAGPDKPGEPTGFNPIEQEREIPASYFPTDPFLVPAPSVEPAQQPTQVLEQQPAQEHGQQPAQVPGQQPAQEHGKQPTLVPEQQPAQEHGLQPAQGPEQQPAQEHGQQPAQGPEQPSQQPAQQPGQEPAKEDPALKRDTALPDPDKPGEATGISPLEQEKISSYFSTEPVEPAPNVEPAQELAQVPGQQSEQQPAQEHLAGKSGLALASAEPHITAKFEDPEKLLAGEPLAAVRSAEIEDPTQANAADESGTHEFPLTSKAKEPQNGTVGSTEVNLSSEEFHDTNREIGKEPLTSAPTTEPVDPVQGHETGKSDTVYISSKPPLASTVAESAPSSEPTERAQGDDDGESGTVFTSSEPQLEELQEAFAKGDAAAEQPVGKSGMAFASLESQLASKSVELEESLVEEPLAVAPSAKLAQASVADKSTTGLVAAESPFVEEPQNGKHGQHEVDHKLTEDVKIPAGHQECIEETFPSDLAHADSDKLKPEAVQDTAERQGSLYRDADQGSFLAFGATSMESKEALEKEPLAAAKLLELFEVEDAGKSGTVLEDSPMTSIVEEPQKPLVEEPLAAVSSAKLVEPAKKAHARRGFARSASEPQLAYQLEEHRKALAKESSVAAAPSALKSEECVQEDFADVQCLPFKILGEGKHPRKESEFKLVEDVQSPAKRPEAAASYVLEPRPSKSKEKKKKEKKDRRQDAAAERHSLGLEEMDRKSSLRGKKRIVNICHEQTKSTSNLSGIGATGSVMLSVLTRSPETSTPCQSLTFVRHLGQILSCKGPCKIFL